MLQASPDSETSPQTLVSIALDLQILICTLLHPSDILALRKTCKTFQLPTRQRVVWVAALHRVCLDNSLFLPSFPILDMSNAELERAAMAPRRWIELFAAFEKQHPNNSCAKLRPRTTRIIQNSLTSSDYPDLFIVPGGRYMVNSSRNGIFVWDLGYTSSADCKLIASVTLNRGRENYYCRIQATPDGMGLVILSCRQKKQCSVYEIYPQSETPQLNRIAHLDFDPATSFEALLLTDRVLWYCSNCSNIIFRVWDYRMNHSTSFLVDIDFRKVEIDFKVMATKTAIIVVCFEEILIWAIPPLSPQPPDSFPDPAHIRLLPHIPLLLRIPYPDGIVRRRAEFVASQTISHWQLGSSQPLYFHILCRDSRLHKFEIIVKPDNLSDTSLRIINTQLVPRDFDITFQRHSICEDTVVAHSKFNDSGQFEVYTLSRFPTTNSPISKGGGSPAKVSLHLTAGARGYNFFLCFLCPASGRYVHPDRDIRGIVVVDLF